MPLLGNEIFFFNYNVGCSLSSLIFLLLLTLQQKSKHPILGNRPARPPLLFFLLIYHNKQGFMDTDRRLPFLSRMIPSFLKTSHVLFPNELAFFWATKSCHESASSSVSNESNPNEATTRISFQPRKQINAGLSFPFFSDSFRLLNKPGNFPSNTTSSFSSFIFALCISWPNQSLSFFSHLKTLTFLIYVFFVPVFFFPPIFFSDFCNSTITRTFSLRSKPSECFFWKGWKEQWRLQDNNR